MSRISEIWSLDGSGHAITAPYLAHLASAAPAPAGFDVWFANSILLNRYFGYYLSVLLEAIPSSETRLRDEGIGGMYNVARGVDGLFNAIALQRGISVPRCPGVAANWKDEAAIDYSILHPALSTVALEPVRRHMEYSTELIHSKGKYHWTSLVVPVSVSADMFLDSMTTEGGPAIDQTLAPKVPPENDMEHPARVMKEELIRIRSKKGETGWKEEEVRQVTMGYLKCTDDFFTCGF